MKFIFSSKALGDKLALMLPKIEDQRFSMEAKSDGTLVFPSIEIHGHRVKEDYDYGDYPIEADKNRWYNLAKFLWSLEEQPIVLTMSVYNDGTLAELHLSQFIKQF